MADHRLQSLMPRLSLFSSSSSQKDVRNNESLCVKFSPYARQIRVESIKDMVEVDKTDIWWQKSDYDGFAKVNRIISKAILEGGSEVFCPSSSPAPNSCTISKITNPSLSESMNPESEALVKHLLEESKFGETPQNLDLKVVQTFHETRSEFCHKFGHSCRGLEHIVFIGEGRQRHSNVRASIRAVLEEQNCQNILLPVGYRDIEKMRSIYVQHTRWATTLARAMGEFDAEEVKCNFDAARVRPRHFFLKTYLAKDARAPEILPVFVQKNLNIATNKLDLDANISSQIFLQNHPRPYTDMQLKRKDSLSYLLKSCESPIVYPEECPEEIKCESDDVLVPPKSEESPTSLAKQAAGFLGYECEDHNQLKIVPSRMGMSSFSPSIIG